MNYQQVEQAGGKNINMLGIITEFSGEGINEKSGKPYKKVKIIDEMGVSHKVTLRGDVLPPLQLLNQRASFSIGTYNGTYQGNPYIGYSGFWNSAANVNPIQPYTLPAMPPAKFGAQMQQVQQIREKVNTTEKDWQICRECCIKAAAEYCGNAVVPSVVIEVAEQWTQYCMTGKIEQVPKNTEHDQQDNEPEPPF